MPSIREIFGETYREDFPLDKVTWKDGAKLKNPFSPHIKRELSYIRRRDMDYQSDYLKRLLTLEASRKIINGAFDFKEAGRCAEFGCGMYGTLYNFLLPEVVGWKQFDINPNAVESNRLFTRKFFGKFQKI